MLCLEIGIMSEVGAARCRSFFSVPYASSSRATPTLCPPWLKFLPSMIVDRVRVTPERRNTNFRFMSVVLKEREFLITGSEFLLVSQADLARVVDLGPDVGVLVQGVLAADAEVGRVVRRRPAEIHRRLQLTVDTLIHAASEDLWMDGSLRFWLFLVCTINASLAVVDVGVQDEVLGGVADAKVVLGQLGLGGIEGHLVAGEPPFVADHGGGVDHRATEVEVDVARQGTRIVLQVRLDLAFKKCEDNFGTSFEPA